MVTSTVQRKRSYQEQQSSDELNCLVVVYVLLLGQTPLRQKAANAMDAPTGFIC